MATSVYFNNQAASREQILLEDLVIESIRNHGIDVYYLPRGSQSAPKTYAEANPDELYGEDPIRAFTRAYKFEIYLESFQSYEGNQEFFSKFGLEVQKAARVTLARRTFQRFVPTAVRNIPKDGDLLWLPVQKKLMEIKFVEQDKNFFQLGRGHVDTYGEYQPYMYGLSLEAFKYNGELINTGIEEIDVVADARTFGVDYTLTAGGSGTYTEHEIVYQGASLAAANCFAYVSNWDLPTRKLRLRNINGQFAPNVAIIGSTSAASWIMTSANVQEDSTDPFDDNMRIETEADNILDWSEMNPFGSPNE